MDAQSYADWEIDYLKYDNCYNTGIAATTRYGTMSTALAETGRDIFYSVCNWGNEDTPSWAPAISNAWRTTPDIATEGNVWLSIKANFL